MAIDVATDTARLQQRHIVFASQQSDVINLRYAGEEKLHRARDQVGLVVLPQGIKVGAVDLVEIEVGCGSPGGALALATAVYMNPLNQRRKLRRGNQAREFQVLIGPDVDHADAVVGIENGDGVVGPDRDPRFQAGGVTKKQRVQ